MITTIYLIRHSIPIKKKLMFQRFLSELKLNKKIGLSEKGKEQAKFKLFNPEYKNVDYIYSSEYLRAYETAKELSSIISKNIIIDSRFNERLHGNGLIESNYEEKQFYDEKFKLKNGESQIEVRERMLNGINDILNKNMGKNIVIFTHSTAITFLLKKWCDIDYLSSYKYNNKEFFNGKIDYVQSFKLVFENNDLKDISFISNEYNEVEVGYLCDKNVDYYRDLLNKKQIENTFNISTKDIYYSKEKVSDLKTKSGEEIKNKSIRIRFCKSIKKDSEYKTFRIQNYRNLLDIFEDKYYSINKFEKIEKQLIENGFNKIIETSKLDYQYINGLQLQDVDGIGLLVYYFNPKYFFESTSKQEKLLKEELIEMGFTFKRYEQFDRLKELINKK